MDKERCIVVWMLPIKDFSKNKRVYDPEALAPTLITGGGGHEAKVIEHGDDMPEQQGEWQTAEPE